MKRYVAALLAALMLLLSGCSWMDGSYVSVTPNAGKPQTENAAIAWISDYEQLYAALLDMVHTGTKENVYFVQNYNQGLLNRDIIQAQTNIKNSDPIGSYALDNITFELDANASQTTLVITIEYVHSWDAISRIRTVSDMAQAESAIGTVLGNCNTELVLHIENYEETDFTQLVETYAMENPDVVMETPKVAVKVYPDSGRSRVVELNFSYQTNRESLREMQSSVQSVFESAELYVSGDESDHEKYQHLYIFLMNRNDYTIQTSITPAYSLLRHAVGDSKAFATVYAAMCRRGGLECQVVSGTRDGEPWFWNIVCVDGVYYHVDLHRCVQQGDYSERGDDAMDGYVWDYSAYPRCGSEPAEIIQPGVDDMNEN